MPHTPTLYTKYAENQIRLLKFTITKRKVNCDIRTNQKYTQYKLTVPRSSFIQALHNFCNSNVILIHFLRSQKKKVFSSHIFPFIFMIFKKSAFYYYTLKTIAVSQSIQKRKQIYTLRLSIRTKIKASKLLLPINTIFLF